MHRDIREIERRTLDQMTQDTYTEMEKGQRRYQKQMQEEMLFHRITLTVTQVVH